MNLDLLLSLKGACVGTLSSFLSLKELITVSHYTTQKNMKYGSFSCLGILLAQAIWFTIAIGLLFFIYKKIGSDSKIVSFMGAIVLFVMAVRTHRTHQNETIKLRLRGMSIQIFLVTFLDAISQPFKILTYASLFIALNPHPHSLTYFQALLSILSAALGITFFWIIFILIVGKSNEPIIPKKRHYFHRLAVCIFVFFSLMNLLRIYFW